MTPSPSTVLEPVTDTCPFCAFEYMGSPTHCDRCGTIQESAIKEIRAKGERARKHLRFQRAFSDLFFLIGLLLGGPMMTLGGQTRLGLLIVLAGGIASVLRRYTEWSTPGTVGVGVLVATVVATAVVDPGSESEEETAAGEEARWAYVQALNEQNPDEMVEARGLGAVTVWFRVAGIETEECGSYPVPEIRGHLSDLGFVRIVVAVPNQSGGMCSFRP